VTESEAVYGAAVSVATLVSVAITFYAGAHAAGILLWLSGSVFFAVFVSKQIGGDEPEVER
jgi:hypothetical protein